jgi:tRNA (Thr-GGU) A37 N-methylase
MEAGRHLVIDRKPIGYVEAARPHAEDDFWGGEQSCIALVQEFGADAVQGLIEFSHIEVLYFFHEITVSKIATGEPGPETTIFVAFQAQRRQLRRPSGRGKFGHQERLEVSMARILTDAEL